MESSPIDTDTVLATPVSLDTLVTLVDVLLSRVKSVTSY